VGHGKGQPELYALLRKELAERGWTRRYFAQQLGLRESTVGRWLSADDAARVIPAAATIFRIARLLDFEPNFLLTAAGYMEPTWAPEPLDDELRQRSRRLRRLLRMIPNAQRSGVLLVIDASLDALEKLIFRMVDQEEDQEIDTSK
jgi:transcriptional regulator with XRE-family HTH domain